MNPSRSRFLSVPLVDLPLLPSAQSHGAPAWVGYVRAAAEAGMVGALADWFAVTALFTPAGHPDPAHRDHQAQEGPTRRGASAFVRENFMSPSGGDRAARRRGCRPARQVAPPIAHAERVAAETSTVLRVSWRSSATRTEHVLDRMIVKRIAEPSGDRRSAGPRHAVGRGRQEALLQLLADRASSGGSMAAPSSSGSSSGTRRPRNHAGSTTSSVTASIAN